MTHGVVVFHEQVLRIIATMTGCSLAEADETRRAMKSPEVRVEIEQWFRPTAERHGYDHDTVAAVWEVLEAFASFGFCKAHAAAFALPTYQSAWFKAHHPAAFLAGVLTHDPGMYPKRLILDDARSLGIAILGLDINISDEAYRVERVPPDPALPPAMLAAPSRSAPPARLPDARGYAIRLSLLEVSGLGEEEVAGARGRREVVIRDHVGHAAKDLFRPRGRLVSATEPCFNVAHRDALDEAREGGSEDGRRVSLREQHVGPELANDPCEALRGCGEHVVQGLIRLHDRKIEIGYQLERTHDAVHEGRVLAREGDARVQIRMM